MAESLATGVEEGRDAQGALGERVAAWGRGLAAWGRGLVAKFGSQSSEGARQDEDEYIRRVAEALGVHPILSPEDLKYQGVQPLGDRERSLQRWISRRGGGDICIRISRGDDGAVDRCWIITDEPASPEVEATQNLLRLKGWDAEVHPAKRSMVALAMDRDLTLSPTEVEETFRNLLRESLRRNASDIHFEVRGDQSQTRLRINGEMQTYSLSTGRPLPVAVVYQIGNYLFNRLAKRGARQFVTTQALNASAQTNIDDVAVALRFATAPDIRGYDIFIRVWKPDSNALPLNELGYTADQQRLLREVIMQPSGVVVFSGPTGSGKSSSLTALLDALPEDDKVKRKVVSLEDPVERELPHVTHVSVNAIVEEGGWKALLGGLNRWDSNINVLGEIKDAETAAAIQDLATSAKLSLTTIHAGGALTIPSRMEELGVEHNLLINPHFLLLLINQRLVPELCPECKVGVTDSRRLQELVAQNQDAENAWAPPESIERLRRLAEQHGGQWFVRGPGCDYESADKSRSCRGTGIVSRVLVAEMIWMDDASRDFIRGRDWNGWRHELLANGWKDIRSHSLEKIKAGLADPVDVERLVTPLEDHGEGA